MKTQNIIKFIQSATLESPDTMHESFQNIMDEKLNAVYETKVLELTKTFFNISEDKEVFSYELGNALSFVLEELRIKPVSDLTEMIDTAATRFNISTYEISQALQEAVSDDSEPEKIQYEPLSETFLKSLNSIILESRPGIMEFKNKTARKVLVNEATELAKVYAKLDKPERIQMVEKMVQSRNDFEGLLEFSLNETKELLALTESQPILKSQDADKIHSLLNRYGYKLDHTASKIQKAKVYKHISNGQSVKVGNLDSLTSIQNHIDGTKNLNQVQV